MSVRVTSEIGPLQAVLVHSPGKELEAVTPGTRDDYLYDDLIGLEVSAREHRRLVAVLKKFAKVFEIGDLLTQALALPEAREFLVAKTLDVVPSKTLARELTELPPRALVRLLIEGVEAKGGPISRMVNEVGFSLPPLPNLFFPRDVGVVVGEHAVVGSMRYGIRWTEELLVTTLFRYHPELANAGILYDGFEERRSNHTLEGGDVHVLREDLLLVGFSERSSPAALDRLADVAFERTARDRHDRGADAPAPDRDPPRHAVHPSRPRPLRGLSAHVHRPGAAHHPAPEEGPEDRPGAERHLRRPEAGGPPAPADPDRGRAPDHPGAGAVGQRLQLLRPPSRHGPELPAERSHLEGAGEGGIRGGAEPGFRGLRRLGGIAEPGGDHHSGERAGAGRRGPPLHDDADPAARFVTGVAPVPAGTLADRAIGLLGGGPRPASAISQEVFGMPRAPTAVAERLTVALLGADPRVRRLPDGRWSLVAAAAGSPLIGDCAFAVVDVETTGGRFGGADRVTELAVVVVQGVRCEVVLDTLVNPERPIPSFVSSVTGITNAMVRAAPTFDEVADQVLEALAGRVFVAHNVRFDWRFLSGELRRARGLALDGARLCTVRLARALVFGIGSYALDNVSHFFGVENPARHRAGGDAWTTGRVLQSLLMLAGEREARTLQDLEGLQGRRQGKKRRGRRGRSAPEDML